MAVLCRHFGFMHMEIAEDIASDTFLKAVEHWTTKGTPANPAAWLYAVARNRAKDYSKRAALYETHIKEATEPNEKEEYFEFSNQNIIDSQLAMIFAVCNPANSPEAQICLALQILCGFSIEEIADAFLAKPETVKKRLHRAKINLRKDNFQLKNLSEIEITSRLDIVLRALYLLFNEGYFSKSNNQQIRKDLCSEAVRLTLLLTENPLTDLPQTNALLALMCFQSSRLEARTDYNGEAILFDEQDRNLWDNSLIHKGNYYLVKATNGHEVSKYHLEAGIAYWHTTPTGESKWQHILQLYNRLVLIEYSPVTALNRMFAFSKVYGNKKAIFEAEKLKLITNNYYYQLLAYLYSETDIAKAVEYYQQAIQLTKSKAEKQTLVKRISQLKKQAVR